MNNKTIKPGAFQTGRTKGGLNLNKFVKDLLVSINFATVDDILCCTFYPTYPTVIVVDESAPTEAEMVDIPVKGVFFAETSEGVWALRVKISAASSAEITTSD